MGGLLTTFSRFLSTRMKRPRHLITGKEGKCNEKTKLENKIPPKRLLYDLQDDNHEPASSATPQVLTGQLEKYLAVLERGHEHLNADSVLARWLQALFCHQVGHENAVIQQAEEVGQRVDEFRGNI